MNRRGFIAASVAALFAPHLARAQAGYRRLLVLVELKGGNDGLNAVVPYADARYYDLRPRIAINLKKCWANHLHDQPTLPQAMSSCSIAKGEPGLF